MSEFTFGFLLGAGLFCWKAILDIQSLKASVEEAFKAHRKARDIAEERIRELTQLAQEMRETLRDDCNLGGRYNPNEYLRYLDSLWPEWLVKWAEIPEEREEGADT